MSRQGRETNNNNNNEFLNRMALQYMRTTIARTTIAFLQMALNSLAIRGLIANETRQRWKKVDTSVYIEQTLAVNSY